jgi:hypothetical protein
MVNVERGKRKEERRKKKEERRKRSAILKIKANKKAAFPNMPLFVIVIAYGRFGSITSLMK